jgi:hypothetical protein
MPIHDWSRVPAGIFHHFHHEWITEIARALNRGGLPADYHARAEQADQGSRRSPDERGGSLLLAPPRTRPTAEAEMEFYRRKQSLIAVRQVRGDRVAAIIEVVSPGNKSARNALDRFVLNAADHLDHRVHLVILDLVPPGRHDPQGIHGAIWDYIADQAYSPPPGKPLTLASYEAEPVFRAFVESVAVGDALPDMPLFLQPNGCVEVPLEDSYRSAWEAVPRRGKQVLEAPR